MKALKKAVPAKPQAMIEEPVAQPNRNGSKTTKHTKEVVSAQFGTGDTLKQPATLKNSEVSVLSLSLPFVRVYPVTWMHFNREKKLLTVARANSTIEIWSYPY